MMIRLTLTKDRLYDLTLDHASSRPNAYRFGRISSKSVRCYARRAAAGAKTLFGGLLRIITTAKLRRIEREFRIHGPNHDWLRIDDDHFTPVDSLEHDRKSGRRFSPGQTRSVCSEIMLKQK